MLGVIRTSISDEQIYGQLFSKAQSGAYTSYIRGKRCKTEDDFFREISASFQFPWYFGENWAAFDECICDLEWLSFERIFVVINDYSQVFNGDIALQDLLIKYLSYAIAYWDSKKIIFEVVLNR